MLDVGVDHIGATDVVFEGITPAPIDSPRRRSHMVEDVVLRMEVGVATLADLVVCGLSCKPFVYRVFFANISLCFVSLVFYLSHR